MSTNVEQLSMNINFTMCKRNRSSNDFSNEGETLIEFEHIYFREMTAKKETITDRYGWKIMTVRQCSIVE